MRPPVIQVEHLSISSPAGPIFRDISFEIYPGEIVALTGVSGSGKTSIANLIMGLLPPGLWMQEGVIKLHFKDSTFYQLPGNEKAWAGLRGHRLGFMQQDVYGAFDPVMRMGKQLMMIIAERTGMANDNIEPLLKTAMKSLGLAEVDRISNSFPHQLSGGQLQRCLLSMMVVLLPEILIVDEPTSAVDKVHQREVLDALRLAKEKYNIAILCITHDREVVNYLADREVPLSPSQNSLPDVEKIEIRDHDPAPLLTMRDVGYRYKFGGLFSKKGAEIQGITLAVKEGKCIGIVGESGSGKSTIAQLMVGLLIPHEGEVMLRGKPVDFRRIGDIQDLRSHIQLVIQDGRGSLHPHKTVRYSLSEVAIQGKEPEMPMESKLIRVLEEVNLPPDVLSRYPSQLSGGECFRVSLARALLKDPAVLICDESTAALDTDNINEILLLLNRLKIERGLSLVLITHDTGLIMRMADEIVVVAEGAIIEMGKTDEVINAPKHPFTRNMFYSNVRP